MGNVVSISDYKKRKSKNSHIHLSWDEESTRGYEYCKECFKNCSERNPKVHALKSFLSSMNKMVDDRTPLWWMRLSISAEMLGDTDNFEMVLGSSISKYPATDNLEFLRLNEFETPYKGNSKPDQDLEVRLLSDITNYNLLLRSVIPDNCFVWWYGIFMHEFVSGLVDQGAKVVEYTHDKANDVLIAVFSYPNTGRHSEIKIDFGVGHLDVVQMFKLWR